MYLPFLMERYEVEIMVWNHIKFEDGSNPYICKTDKELERMKRKYDLVQLDGNFWLAKDHKAKVDLGGLMF